MFYARFIEQALAAIWNQEFWESDKNWGSNCISRETSEVFIPAPSIPFNISTIRASKFE